MIKNITKAILMVLPTFSYAGLNDNQGLKLPMIQQGIVLKHTTHSSEALVHNQGFLLTVSDWLARYAMIGIFIGLLAGLFFLWRMERKDIPIDNDS